VLTSSSVSPPLRPMILLCTNRHPDYGTQYFKNSGIKNAFVVSMITSAVNVASTLPGLWAVDKFGRRPLLLWGAVGMCVSQLIVAVTGTTSSAQTATGEVYATNVAAQKAGIAFICIYIFFFASTWVSLYSLLTPIHLLTPRPTGSSRMGCNW
jgi:SP family sugar:H+ symporter-like MFS transporter